MESRSIIAQKRVKKSTCGLSCTSIMVMMVMKYADNTWLSKSGVTTMLAAIMFLIFVVLFFCYSH